MDLLRLLVARSLKHPFTISLEGMEKRPQPEPEIPAIRFALLSKVTGEQNR